MNFCEETAFVNKYAIGRCADECFTGSRKCVAKEYFACRRIELRAHESTILPEKDLVAVGVHVEITINFKEIFKHPLFIRGSNSFFKISGCPINDIQIIS